MYSPVLFRERSRPGQVLIGGVIPAALGAVAGILLAVITTVVGALLGAAGGRMARLRRTQVRVAR